MLTYQSRDILHGRIHDLHLTVGLVLALLGIGTAGYMLIEGWGPVDAFYMTLTTVTTVGFGEVHELSAKGRVFTAILIFGGVGTAAYAFARGTRSIVEGEIRQFREFKRMEKKVASLSGHTIICGYGRLARIVVDELEEVTENFVVIDNDPSDIAELQSLGVNYIEGSAYDDNTLIAAGIKRAKTLLSLLPKDADNVYVTLCARELNPTITIIARTEDEMGESRLRRAGAHRVVAPYRLSGTRIVQQLIRPNVSDFLEVAVGKTEAPLVLEEVLVPPQSSLSGKTVEESELRNKTGVIIAAFIDSSGKMIFNPGGKSLIEPGTTMIVLGEPGSLEKLNHLLGD